MHDWILTLPIILIAVICLLISFVVTYLAIPQVINVVRVKGLMDNPNERSSHDKKTPTLGGVAFFISIIVTLFLISCYDKSVVGVNIAVGLTLLFFVGLKDDILGVNPLVKIVTQVIVAFILLSNPDFQTYSLSGFLGIYNLPNTISLLIDCFVILLIVNSYNLIDGINGSASMVGISIFISFAFVFFQMADYYYFLLALSSAAFLFAFLRYNLSSKFRIFMGDTGSMIVGFIIGILSLRYMSIGPIELKMAFINPTNKIIVIFALLFIPFIDTSRVFFIRLIKNGKPFVADRNHVHHVMIDYIGLSHPLASLTLSLINLFVFVTVYVVNIFFSTLFVYLYFIIIILLFSVFLFYFNRSFHARKQKRKFKSAFNLFSKNNKNTSNNNN